MSNRKGFTLFELLIYMAIIATISLIMTSTFLSLGRGRGQVNVRSDVNTSLRFGIERISQDIRLASAVTTPGTAGGSAATLVMTVSGNTITYDVFGGQLRRQVNAGAPDPLTPITVTFSTPTFTRYENTNTVLSKTVATILVDLTGSFNSSSPDEQYSERKKTTIALR